MHPPVVVLGAGSVGCLVAARLGARTPVQLVARPRTARAIADAGGIRIEGWGRGLYPVRVRTRLAVPRGAVVVVAVKAYDLPRLLPVLATRLHPGDRVVLVQNGLGISQLARSLLGREAIRAVTSLAATRLGPGHIRWVGAGSTCFPAGTGLERLWNASGLPAVAVGDQRPHVWRKVAVNAVINPLGALLGVENGRLLGLPHLPGLLVGEVVRVAGAGGVPLSARATLAHVRACMRRTAGNACSMLQDLRAGRPTEIDWLNAAVARLAERYGVPAPCNAALAELVQAQSRAAARARGRTRTDGAG